MLGIYGQRSTAVRDWKRIVVRMRCRTGYLVGRTGGWRLLVVRLIGVSSSTCVTTSVYHLFNYLVPKYVQIPRLRTDHYTL